jgi:opacity protein-like surface antigen
MKGYKILAFHTTFATSLLLADLSIAESNISAKAELGYINANKYTDYTPGNKEKISGAKSEDNLLYGGEIFYRIHKQFRMGSSFEFSSHKFSKAFIEDGKVNGAMLKIKTAALMLNSYYDFYPVGDLQFYLTAGMGVARNKSGDYILTSPEDDNFKVRFPGRVANQFAWQAGLGVQIPIDKKLSIDIAAKYFDYGKTSTKNIAYISDNHTAYTDHAGMVGTKLRGGLITMGLVMNF